MASDLMALGEIRRIDSPPMAYERTCLAAYVQFKFRNVIKCPCFRRKFSAFGPEMLARRQGELAGPGRWMKPFARVRADMKLEVCRPHEERVLATTPSPTEQGLRPKKRSGGAKGQTGPTPSIPTHSPDRFLQLRS